MPSKMVMCTRTVHLIAYTESKAFTWYKYTNGKLGGGSVTESEWTINSSPSLMTHTKRVHTTRMLGSIREGLQSLFFSLQGPCKRDRQRSIFYRSN